MKKIQPILLCVILGLLFSGISQAQVSKHASVRSVSIVSKGFKWFLTHPISDLKAIVTPPLKANAIVSDVLHVGFAAADKATNMGSGRVFGIAHFPFVIGDRVSGYYDEYSDLIEAKFALPVPVD